MFQELCPTGNKQGEASLTTFGKMLFTKGKLLGTSTPTIIMLNGKDLPNLLIKYNHIKQTTLYYLYYRSNDDRLEMMVMMT